MRILIHDYAGHPFAVELSRALAAQGHPVLHAYAGSLQTPRGDLARRKDDPSTFESLQVEMDSQYSRFKYSFLRRRKMEIEYGRRCATLISEWKPEVVLSANTPTETQRFLLQASKSIGARFVLWIQDFYSIAVDKLVRKKIPVLGFLVGNYYKRMDRRQFQSSDHLVAITDDFIPILDGEFGIENSKVTTIPNWAPIDTLPVLEKENPWSKEYGLHDRFVYLYSGTLGMKHNPDLLLQLAIQNKENDHVRVLVISEGIGARWLIEQKMALGLTNLYVLAYQPFSLMPQVLAAGNVLIAVLEEDAGVFSVPSKVLTYLCARRPLLLAVPEVNLAARIIVETRAGLTVAPSDGAGFLAAARELLDKKPAAGEMADNGRTYAESTFQIGDILKKFAPVLNLPQAPQVTKAALPEVLLEA